MYPVRSVPHVSGLDLGPTKIWWARPDLNLGPTVAFRKAMLLIRLASCCVIDHGFGGILGFCSRIVLEPVNEP
jgi:hypothetical protein